jgi:hypothetical protein
MAIRPDHLSIEQIEEMTIVWPGVAEIRDLKKVAPPIGKMV